MHEKWPPVETEFEWLFEFAVFLMQVLAVVIFLNLILYTLSIP